MRCEYCTYRYSWECEEYWVSNNKMCDDFKLDFNTLSESQKKAIQKRLMGESYDS